MTIWNLYDKAVDEVDAGRENRIKEAYIGKLEARIKELEERATVEAKPVQTFDVQRVDTLVEVLNGMPVFRLNEGTGKILKIKILRAAFGLGLKEAKDAIEKGYWAPVNPDDGYDDLPF